MKFLEISDGISIKKECIVCVKKLNDFQSSLILENGSMFDSSFPYITMLQLLESEEENDKEDKLLKEISTKIGNIGTFAG